MNTFFTADLHLGHSRILTLGKGRPFNTIDEMDDTIISNWNAVVTNEDMIYILGDFSFGNTRKTLDYLQRLRGRKILVSGNHDGKRQTVAIREEYEAIHNLVRIKVNDKKAINGYHTPIVLCHYALRSWQNSHYGTWHLYGHSHGMLSDIGGLCMDVGVDCHNFYPVSYEVIRMYMLQRTQTIDHRTKE